MPKQPLSYRRDSYTAVRGKPSLLHVTCFRCNTFIALYQKDGPGPLKRMYLDRILGPAAAVNAGAKKKDLTCKGCGDILAIPIIYTKEKRPAFRLFAAAVTGKQISLKKASSLPL